jgi:hypothetical protein
MSRYDVYAAFPSLEFAECGEQNFFYLSEQDLPRPGTLSSENETHHVCMNIVTASQFTVAHSQQQIAL